MKLIPKTYLNLFLFALLSIQTLSAQKKIFFDQYWGKTKEKKALYYRIVTPDNKLFKVKDYVKKSNKLYMTGTYTSSKGLYNSRNGVFVYYFSNGNKSSEGTYIKGKKVGIWKSWYKNGQLKSMGNYDRDLRQGDFVFYHKNGSVKSKKTFVDNEIDGFSVLYYDNGNIDEEFTFFKGKFNGPFKSFYSNGQLKSKGNYEKDNLMGQVKHYWKNGNLSFIKNYSNNLRNGVQVYCHSNGNKSCEEEYNKDVFIYAYFFDEEGVKIDKKVFEDDLYNRPGYPGGNNAMSEFINKQILKNVDIETAKNQGLVYEINVQLNVDEEGLITERIWLKPDEDEYEDDDYWGFIKNFNNVIDIMPRFHPSKSHNRYDETVYWVYYKIVFTKKNISTYIKVI
jgi:antitoxin component YwqK of YwqJK toxin-antitoxin module